MKLEQIEFNQEIRQNLFIILIIIYLIIQTVNCFKSTVQNFVQSIEYNNKATRLENLGGSYELINPERMDKIIEFKKKALEEAMLVNIEKLNHRYPDFGNHFRDEFMKGLELFIEGVEKNNTLKLLAGQMLEDKWGAWYDHNIDGIKRGKKD